MVILSAYNLYLKPKVARDVKYMKREFSREFYFAILTLLSISLIVFVINLLFHKKIQLIWPILSDHNLLAYYFLLFGYLVNLSTGGVGVILNMTGNTTKSIRINIFCLVLQIIVGFGAAFSQSLLIYSIGIGLVFMIENILKIILVKKLLQ